MGKNIRFDLQVENQLREIFFNKYMPMNKKISEIIEMFMEDEDYTVITKDKKEMQKKLDDWAKLYYELNPKKKILNYNELKNRMKKIVIAWRSSRIYRGNFC